MKRVTAPGIILLLSCMSSIIMSAHSLRTFQSNINMGEIKVTVVFQQQNVSSPVEVMMQNNLTSTFAWAIHEYPFVYDRSGSMSCAETGQMMQGGNLTALVGRLGSKSSYSTSQLTLYGNATLFGRSVVIYNNDGTTMRACANVLEQTNTVVYSVATVQGTVSGKVEFFQFQGTPNEEETVIIGELFYVNGTTDSSSGHGWFIGTGSIVNGCGSAGPMLMSSKVGACSMFNHQGCDQGNLTGKLGPLSIGVAGSNRNGRRPFRFVDLNLNVPSVSLNFGKPLAIESAGVNVACGLVQRMGPMEFYADFSQVGQGVSGGISFSQLSRYHTTQVTLDINGLNMNAKGYHVHEYPIPVPVPASNACSADNVGAHLNPFGLNNTATSYPPPRVGTSDQYEVGDLSGKFGTLEGKSSAKETYHAVQILLYGRYSILGRALVVHRNDSAGSRWFCANIVPQNAVKLSGRTNFAPTSEYSGYVDVEQYIQLNGIHTDTGLTVSLNPKVGGATKDHNWHVHIDRIGNDYNSSTSICQSVLGHYNPHGVNDKGNYSSECSPLFPNRCELGDLSNKQAPYSIGDGKNYFVDVDTPLFGRFSVLGRSFTFHAVNRGAARIACADIIPMIGQYADLVKVAYKLTNKTAFSGEQYTQTLASAINLETWQIAYVSRMDVTKDLCNSELSFYVLGSSATETAAKLKELVMSKASSLQGYDGKCDSSLASNVRSTLLFLMLPFGLALKNWLWYENL